MFRESFSRIANEYLSEKNRPLKGSDLANFIRNELPKGFSRSLPDDFDDLIITGSPGQGNWADVPWVGLFDPLVTKTAMAGYYIVYLFDADMKHLYLSLNQGTTAVYHEFGPRFGRQVLRDRADTIRARLKFLYDSFAVREIDLSSTGSLALGYEAGHAFGLSYKLSTLPDDDQLSMDLARILKLYRTLTYRGGLVPSDILLETGGTKEIEEARRYQVSRRIERNSKVRKDVLSIKEAICEGCGLNPKTHLNMIELKNNSVPLDVHHLTPISEISEGDKLTYRIPDDFALLCPTCHRLIHLLEDASDIDALRGIVRFKHMTELF